jgi:hypothetical protein
MRVKALLAACAVIPLVGGCATQVIGTITLSNISSVAGIASTLATGQDLGEHALSLIMGKDCRFSEALITDERDICEEHGSPRTKNDFQGVLIAGTDAEGNVVRAAPMMMSATDGAIEDSSVEAVLVKIHGAQQTQFAEAEQRVAARTRQANEALLAFASGSPNSNSAPAPAAVAQAEEYKSVISGPVVVLRLAPIAPVAVAEAVTPEVAETSAPVQVASLAPTPIRKPVSFQVASAEPVDAPETPAQVAQVAPTPAAVPQEETKVVEASLFSGTRLIVPLRRQVSLVSTASATAGASLLAPVATLTEAPAPATAQSE